MPTFEQDTEINIETSVRQSYDYRYANDTALALTTGIINDFQCPVSVQHDPAPPTTNQTIFYDAWSLLAFGDGLPVNAWSSDGNYTLTQGTTIDMPLLSTTSPVYASFLGAQNLNGFYTPFVETHELFLLLRITDNTKSGTVIDFGGANVAFNLGQITVNSYTTPTLTEDSWYIIHTGYNYPSFIEVWDANTGMLVYTNSGGAASGGIGIIQSFGDGYDAAFDLSQVVAYDTTSVIPAADSLLVMQYLFSLTSSPKINLPIIFPEPSVPLTNEL